MNRMYSNGKNEFKERKKKPEKLKLDFHYVHHI